MTDTPANPWLHVPLADYEGHMALPAVAQASMLAEVFGAAVDRLRPTSLAVLGCAGGNGFDRIHPAVTDRIVGIDINPCYLDTVSARFRDRLAGLELHTADLNRQKLSLEPVGLIFAGLLFEHVDPDRALETAKHLAKPSGTLLTVLQLASPTQPTVSPSPFRSLEPVGAQMQLLDPDAFVGKASRAGFALADSRRITLSSGKSFVVLELTRAG